MKTFDTEQHFISEDLLAALSRLDFPEGQMTVRNRVSSGETRERRRQLRWRDNRRADASNSRNCGNSAAL
jgi:hypothetical protein